VIAFATAIADAEAHRRYAEPGIRAAAEPDSAVLAYAAAGSMARSANLLLDAAAALDGLEALVLVDTHAQIAGPRFAAKVRAALADPDVAVVGVAGARGVHGLAWWEGAVAAAPVVRRYHEHGGGELPAYAWAHPAPAPAEVDVVDGQLMVLAPWAVRELRFDEGLATTRGWDLDFCLRAREAGRKVVVADIALTLHGPLDVIGDPELWVQEQLRFTSRWDRANGATDWRARARRAEAEREAARIQGYFEALILERQVERLEREFAEATGTAGWRLTAPLRRLNHARRQRRR
jgi:hypothetical protein